jgi:hypothetical protein
MALPGRWGSETLAEFFASPAGRPQRGNPLVLRRTALGEEVGFVFEDGCCNRPGSAYVNLVMHFDAFGVGPLPGGFDGDLDGRL